MANRIWAAAGFVVMVMTILVMSQDQTSPLSTVLQRLQTAVRPLNIVADPTLDVNGQLLSLLLQAQNFLAAINETIVASLDDDQKQTYQSIKGIIKAYIVFLPFTEPLETPADRDNAINGLISALNDTDTKNALIQSRFLTVQLPNGNSVLGAFAKLGHAKALRALLEAGLFVDLADNNSWTPLIHAAHNNHSEAVKVLLEYRADPNIRNNHGDTALHWAVSNDQLVTVQDLLAAGADPNLSDRRGQTPLTLSANFGNPEVVRLLLQWNAGINILSNDGWSPLMWAARSDHLEVVRLLLEAGADVNIRNLDYGDTALGWAANNGNADILKELIAAGSDLDARNHRGSTPLILASLVNKVKAASVLLLAGANINLRANDGDTALMDAVHFGHTQMIKLLLEHCPDLTIFNNNRKTAEDIAFTRNNEVRSLVFGHKNSTCIRDRQIHILGALCYDGCIQVQCCQGVWTPNGEVLPTCGRKCQTVGSPAGYCTLVEDCPKLEREFIDSMAAENEDVLADFVRSYGCGVTRAGIVELCCPLA